MTLKERKKNQFIQFLTASFSINAFSVLISFSTPPQKRNRKRIHLWEHEYGMSFRTKFLKITNIQSKREMQITGKIKLINAAQTFGSNGFRKREVVVTTDEQYPQMILIEFVQDKCELLDNYSVGQDVTISINLRGREWVNKEGETKYFNSIQGWRIEGLQNQGQNAAPAGGFETTSAPTEASNEPDDLPF
jgi:hypothetical protein